MYQYRKYRSILWNLLTIAAVTLTSCADSAWHQRLLLAEEQVTQSLDSCARLLEGIPVEELNAEDAALHGLISSWMLYRQYAPEIPDRPLETAFGYYRESRDPLRRAQVYFLHSVIRQDQKRGQTSEWMEDLYAACLAIEQTDDHLLASQIYQNYSSKLSEVGRFDEASVWVDRFVDAAQRSGHRGEYVQSLIFKADNRLYAEEARIMRQYNTKDGRVVAQHTRFEDAFAVIYQALGLAREHQMDVELGRIYTKLALFHSRAQHLDSLLHYARLSTWLNEQLYAQGRRRQLPHHITLADAYRKLGQADSAIYYARRTFDTPGMPLRNRRVAAQILYNTYADLVGDYQTSMEWMRTFNELGDSINQHTIATNIEAVQEAALREQEKTALREQEAHTRDWLHSCLIIAALVISAILLRMRHNRRRYLQHLRQQEEDFNRRIAGMRAPISSPAAPATQPPTPPARIVLTGSTREQIEVEASSILFLTSESNYVKVLHLDAAGKVQSRMIRQTMSNVEAQLNAYPGIIRCHRAFIVNLQHVRHATSSPSGLQLTLDATTLHVPVSKTYLSLVKECLG